MNEWKQKMNNEWKKRKWMINDKRKNEWLKSEKENEWKKEWMMNE